VLLSVNRVGQRTTEHRAAPRQTISKRSNVAGVAEGEGLEKVATLATWVGKISASDLRCARHRTISQQSWRSTLDDSSSVLTKLEPSALLREEGTVGSRAGRRLRQRKPQPLTPRPSACLVRGQARPLDPGPLRLLRTTPVTCGITIPSITGVIRIPLALELKGGMQGERQVAGHTCGTRQSPAQARLLVPARGTENCKQSSCCCAVVR
jgi:hypothetical protein